MTRVLLVDDHLLLRDSLRGALQDAGIDVVAEAGDGAEAVDQAVRVRPDVVLMDVMMPVVDGIEATRRIKRVLPGVPVLIITMHADPRLLADARAAGASGYLLKDASVAELADAVSRVVAGGVVISPALGSVGDVEVVSSPPPVDLSARETEILQLLADGASPGEVADALVISPNTVRNHLASIYTKLEVGDRTQAVLEGLRQGVVSLRRTVSQRPARSAVETN